MGIVTVDAVPAAATGVGAGAIAGNKALVAIAGVVVCAMAELHTSSCPLLVFGIGAISGDVVAVAASTAVAA